MWNLTRTVEYDGVLPTKEDTITEQKRDSYGDRKAWHLAPVSHSLVEYSFYRLLKSITHIGLADKSLTPNRDHLLAHQRVFNTLPVLTSTPGTSLLL